MPLRPIALAAGLVLATAQAYAADDALDACRKAPEAADRLAACSAVIDSPEYTAAQRALAFRLRGLERLGAGAVDEAIADFSQDLSLSPKDATAYSARARAHMTKGDLDAAVTDYSAALEHTPERKAKLSLLIGRGHTLMVKGLFDPALADLDEAIRINPKSSSAYNHRGLIHRKMGDNARAIEDYTVAVSLNPIYALAYSNRGHAYEALGNRKEAIRDFSRALLLDGSLTSASDRLKALNAGSVLVGESERLIAEGKDLADRTCAFCHAVGDKGASPNAKAPPFHTLAERHPELSLHEPLSRGVLAPHDVMPNFALTDREVDGLVAYINTLGR